MSAPIATTATSNSATEICLSASRSVESSCMRVRDEGRDPLDRALVRVDAGHLAVQLREGGRDGRAEAPEADHEDLSLPSQ